MEKGSLKSSFLLMSSVKFAAPFSVILVPVKLTSLKLRPVDR